MHTHAPSELNTPQPRHTPTPSPLCTCREQKLPRPHLVVVPLSTLPNWEREFALWAPQLNVVQLYGNQSARDVVIKHELYAPAVPGERSNSSSGRQVRDGLAIRF